MIRPPIGFVLGTLALCMPALHGGATASAQDAASQSSTVRAPAPREVPLTRRAHFEHLTMESGLSHSEVLAVAEDRHGFVWFGTENGLNRFDGYRMTVFRHDPLDPNSLGSSLIESIHEDEQGMLWLAHGPNGVTRFNPVDETFQRYRHDPDDPESLAGDVIFRVFGDTLGRVWFSGPPGVGGLTYRDSSTHHLTRVEMATDPPPEAYQGGVVWDTVEGDAGRLWLAADFLVEELDPKTGKFTHYLPPRTDRRIMAMVQGADGSVWAGGWNGIYRVDRSSQQLVPAPLRIARISSMARDAEGRFWIGTDDGLYVADSSMTRVLHYYRHDARESSSLPSQQVRELRWSRGGLLWIATDGGLATFHPGQDRFVTLGLPWSEATMAKRQRGLSGNPDGDLWMTHGQGIAKVDVDTRTAEFFDFGRVLGDGVPVGVIYVGSRGRVWFSRGERIHRFDVARRELSSFDLPLRERVSEQNRVPAEGPPAEVTAFAEDASGTIWVAAEQAGLFYLEEGADRIELFRPVMETPRAPDLPPSPFHFASSALFSRSGTLWIGTGVGEIFAVDPVGRRVDRMFAPGDYASLPARRINVIHEDPRGDLWLGTQSGLVHFEPGRPMFKLYGRDAGIESPATESILEDRTGCLWLGTRRGLVRFDPRSEKFRRYDADDGVPGNDLLAGAWPSPNGRLVFADSAGFTLFDPQSLTDSDYDPPLLLTEFQLLYQAQHPSEGSVLARPIWDTSSVTLAPHQNVFGFEFAALDYIHPSKNRYRYRLEGFDDTWHEVDSKQRFATYTHVPPGEYTFRVERQRGDGAWQEGGASVQLTVRRPWWTTAWARTLALLTVFATVLLWHRARLAGVRKQNLVLEQKVASRTEALEEANRQLALAATTDPLTGLPNRRHYIDRVEQELAKLRRTGRRLTIALADIDDFKDINDALGHDIGDQVIRQVAEILRTQVREQDVVARWGGEEFIFLFPETDAAGATVVSEKIRARVEESTFSAHGESVGVTVTVGLAEVATSGPIAAFTARADEALYQGKRGGKNRVVIGRPDEGRASTKVVASASRLKSRA